MTEMSKGAYFSYLNKLIVLLLLTFVPIFFILEKQVKNTCTEMKSLMNEDDPRLHGYSI
jgi:hypothetical protein